VPVTAYFTVTEFELHVGRCERQLLGRISNLGLRYGRGDRDLVACFAFYDQTYPAGSEDRTNRGRAPYSCRGIGEPEHPVHGTRDLVVFVAQWHTAKLPPTNDAFLARIISMKMFLFLCLFQFSLKLYLYDKYLVVIT